MVEIHKFVFAMIQFISVFLVTTEVGRCKSCFIHFKFPSLLCSSYTTFFYHVLVTLFYYISSLHCGMDVKRMRIVHDIHTIVFL